MGHWSEWKRRHWDDWVSFVDPVSGQYIKERRPLHRKADAAIKVWRWSKWLVLIVIAAVVGALADEAVRKLFG